MEAAIVGVLCCATGWKAVAMAVVLVVVITTSVLLGVHPGDLAATVYSVFRLVIEVG